ncbi:pilus assembly protein PilP [Chromatium okenii]|uniref:pilus assembly protein PilP n=1 Tax=Chromatium okenii TaxID=61644 RepID=UPI0034E971B7
MMCRLLPLLILVLTVAQLAGCGDDETAALEAYVQEIKQRPPGGITPLPEIEPIETFVYIPSDRRDPFVPDEKAMPVEEKPLENELAPDPNRRKEELESVPLDSLRMVGTLDQGEERWALVKNKDGTLYRVKVGNYLGLNNGQIVNISENAIQLNEIVADAPGQWRERQATIALSE